MADQADKVVVEITPEMIEAGVMALSRHVPFDLAFPLGDAETAVRAVLESALARSRSRSVSPSSQRTLENMLKAPPKPHKTKEEADDARKPASPKR